eukprot:5191704-Pyramimonas_sp.AAC.1
MRTLRGHETSCWVVADTCGRCHGDLRWSSPWDHEAVYRVVADARGRCDWGLRWSSSGPRSAVLGGG